MPDITSLRLPSRKKITFIERLDSRTRDIQLHLDAIANDIQNIQA